MQNRSIRFGRLKRGNDPRIPHLSALKYSFGQALPPLPVNYNSTSGMDADFGFMLNDQIGDCTCAAFYHARQIWSFHALGQTLTDPDSDVLALYSRATGYNPDAPLDADGRNPTDQGANEQVLLRYLNTTGAPTGVAGLPLDVLKAYAEVDPSNHQDLKRAIHDCGNAYIGFVVPSSWLNTDPENIWDVLPGDQNSDEGHAVILSGWDQNGFNLVSWGRSYYMTNAFLDRFVDEAYALTDVSWTKATGRSLLSMSEDQLTASMRAF